MPDDTDSEVFSKMRPKTGYFWTNADIDGHQQTETAIAAKENDAQSPKQIKNATNEGKRNRSQLRSMTNAMKDSLFGSLIEDSEPEDSAAPLSLMGDY
jgi:hypothetical protein